MRHRRQRRIGHLTQHQQQSNKRRNRHQPERCHRIHAEHQRRQRRAQQTTTAEAGADGGQCRHAFLQPRTLNSPRLRGRHQPRYRQAIQQTREDQPRQSPGARQHPGGHRPDHQRHDAKAGEIPAERGHHHDLTPSSLALASPPG